MMNQLSDDALRISPGFAATAWLDLSESQSGDWAKAVDIVRDRLVGRYLRFANEAVTDPYSGFVVLALDCLLAETIQQFKLGVVNGSGNSAKYIKQFLSGTRFQPHFDENARKHFYSDIRCGLLHQAEAKGMWLVRRGGDNMLHKLEGEGAYIIDVKLFHRAVCDSLDDYFGQLLDPASALQRANLWTKMNHICQTRTARGLLYEVGHSAG